MAGSWDGSAASANATCGFTAGLVPPVAGCEWQLPQPSRFIRRSQAVGDVLGLREILLAELEERELVLRQPG